MTPGINGGLAQLSRGKVWVARCDKDGDILDEMLLSPDEAKAVIESLARSLGELEQQGKEAR